MVLQSQTLGQQVRYWPTPTASDWKGPNFSGSGNASCNSLATKIVIEKLPTPTSRDWKDGTSCDNVPENGLLGRAVKPNKIEGALSADWVELLMGYPKGYTVVEWQKKRKNSKK